MPQKEHKNQPKRLLHKRIKIPATFLNKFRNTKYEFNFRSQKKRNRIKKQLQKIALIEGHDWRNLVREERPLRKKFIQQWGKHHRGMTNSFVVVANQYAALVSKEKKARDILDTKFRPYLEQIVDLDCKIQKAKNMTKSHLTPR